MVRTGTRAPPPRWVAILFVLGACGFLAVSVVFFVKWRSAGALVENHGTVQGTMGAEYTETRKSGSSKYKVSYSYEVDGKTYYGHAEIEDQPTPAVTVYYSPSDPETSSLAPEQERDQARLWTLMIGGAGLCLLVLSVMVLRRSRPPAPK